MKIKIYCHISTYQHDTDPKLISLWQQGDEKAFDCLYKRYVVYLVNIAVKKTGSSAIARECVQDVFLSLYKRKDDLQTVSSLKAYLYTALQNKIYNYYQKELTRLEHEQAASRIFLSSDDDFNAAYDAKELHQQIQKKIQELPPQCRKVFLMSREEQLSYKEIAEQLGISVNTVDQHIQKALRILRTSFTAISLLIMQVL